MLDETNHTSGKSMPYRFGAVQIYFDPDQASPSSMWCWTRLTCGTGGQSEVTDLVI
jgi:hypothetical protein